MSDAQSKVDVDVQSLTTALADMAAEWQQISAQLSAAGVTVDTSKLDALAAQAQAMDQAWKAQLAGSTSTSSSSTASEPASSSTTVAPADSGTAPSGS